ncbi:unnamed protein product [Moneuplotes crassus]|uniref:Uncharacterized protein n=1 Tax=Euplotes crassus TaxID=5936 RepID=A0AAD1U2X4_EUPCR|nr:unnamed protein product [Moneuplotes crassus]
MRNQHRLNVYYMFKKHNRSRISNDSYVKFNLSHSHASRMHSKSLSKVKLNLKFVTSAENLLTPDSPKPKRRRKLGSQKCSQIVSSEFSTHNLLKTRNESYEDSKDLSSHIHKPIQRRKKQRGTHNNRSEFQSPRFFEKIMDKLNENIHKNPRKIKKYNKDEANGSNIFEKIVGKYQPLVKNP